jgi:Flp pilus assembly protein TadD
MAAFFHLYFRPGSAMSEILDRGSLLFSSIAALLVAALMPQLGFSFYTPLLALAVVYVPGVLLLAIPLAGLGGGVRTIFERDYSPLLTCTAMAWAAANVPVMLAGRMLPYEMLAGVFVAAQIYFLVLMFFAIRTVFGTESQRAFLVVVFSWLPLIAVPFVWVPIQHMLGWIASPFVLLYAYYFFGRDIGNIGAGMRRQQSFRRMLDAAAINPHDADAQYQLGLIYQERRQYSEAAQRFKNAVAIDPRDAGAHFQLGRMASEQGRLKEALEHFQAVMSVDDAHQQHEILRELGAVYLAAGQNEDARNFLDEYTQKRPYDPEGLYYSGQAYDRLGESAKARGRYEQATEAARTAPRYRRAQMAKWSRLAQRQLRNPAVS